MYINRIRRRDYEKSGARRWAGTPCTYDSAVRGVSGNTCTYGAEAVFGTLGFLVWDQHMLRDYIWTIGDI